jgi:hypothetical protein
VSFMIFYLVSPEYFGYTLVSDEKDNLCLEVVTCFIQKSAYFLLLPDDGATESTRNIVNL